MSKLRKENTIIFGCTHAPFEHKDYLEFVREIQTRCKCGTVVCAGDLVDNHSISYHEHDPNGWAPAGEMAETDKHLAPWFKAFPKLTLMRGNHDNLVDRKAKTAGLPKRCFENFRDIWRLPRGWVDRFIHTNCGVLYKHGTGYSGKYGHVQAAYDSRQSTVIAHLHSVGGVEYLVNEKSRIFGMAVGCGIDRRKYAFAYGKDFKRKPILGCGVVTDNGKYAQFFPMDL